MHGKRLYKALLDFMMGAGISGATVVNAMEINYPLIIKVVDEQSKLEPLIPQIRRMVDDNGIVTLHEVNLL